MPTSKKLKSQNQIICKVTLLNTEPKVWRRFKFDESMTLDDLHWAIQGSFGWMHSHLHQFSMSRNERYSSNDYLWEDDGFGETASDSSEVSLASLLEKNKKSFKYEYDFGDGWIHEVKLEKIISDSSAKIKYPECLEGDNAGPPEDCGGVGGFEDFKEIMANKKHPEYLEMKAWYGASYDSKKFDAKSSTARIKKFMNGQFE